jgi:Uma2 family endonuclease
MNVHVRPQVEERLFTVEELIAANDAGLFGEDEWVELVDGRMVVMPSEGWPHVNVNSYILRTLILALNAAPELEAEWRLLATPTLRLNDRNARIPDMALVRRAGVESEERLPTAADIGFALETSHTSLRYDEGEKTDTYLRFGLQEIWIVRVAYRDVHVRRRPVEGEYSEDFILKPGERLSPLCAPTMSVAVSEFFGPVAPGPARA